MSMITLVPDRVVNPALPIETPNVRIVSPSLRTTIRCLAFETRMTKARPTRNPVSVSRRPQRPGPACTFRRFAATDTRVYAGQKPRGRNCTVRSDVQDHEAAASALLVRTRSAFSTWALRRTSWLNVTTSGRPTPTVRPDGLIVARSTRAGAPVRSVSCRTACWPSASTATAWSVYVERGTSVPVLVQVVGAAVPRTCRPSAPVRVADTRVPPETVTLTASAIGQAVAPAALLVTVSPVAEVPAALAVGDPPSRGRATRAAASSGSRGRRSRTVGDLRVSRA